MTDGGLLIQFRIEGDDCPLAAVTRETETAIEAKPGLLRSDGNVLLQFQAMTNAEKIAHRLEEEQRLRYVHAIERSGDTEFRCLSLDPCVQHQLFNIGFMPLSIRYQTGHEYYTGAVIGHETMKQVVGHAYESVNVQLQGIQQMEVAESKRLTQRWDITPAQREAIVAGLEHGYFAVPRELSAEEVATKLGISQSAYLQRVHRAEARIFEQIFAQ